MTVPLMHTHQMLRRYIHKTHIYGKTVVVLLDSFRINWIPRRIFAKDAYLSKWLLYFHCCIYSLRQSVQQLESSLCVFVFFLSLHFRCWFTNESRLLNSNYSYCYVATTGATFIVHDLSERFHFHQPGLKRKVLTSIKHKMLEDT